MEGICSSIEMWNAYWLRGALSFLSVTGMVLAGTRFGCELRSVIANLSTVELSLQWTNYIKMFVGQNPYSWPYGKNKIIHHECVRWKTSPLVKVFLLSCISAKCTVILCIALIKQLKSRECVGILAGFMECPESVSLIMAGVVFGMDTYCLRQFWWSYHRSEDR